MYLSRVTTKARLPTSKPLPQFEKHWLYTVVALNTAICTTKSLHTMGLWAVYIDNGQRVAGLTHIH